MKDAKNCLAYIEASPTAYHAVETAKKYLIKAGFSELSEGEIWKLVKGGKYFTTRNGSSIIGFTIGEKMEELAFNITASHTDSPTFKIKENFEVSGPHYSKLNMEGYGGMILSTWLDRPLALAGRVLIKNKLGIESRLYQSEAICLIPNVAPHMNRSVNKETTYKAVDMCPIVSDQNKASVKDRVAADLKIASEDILSMELCLVANTPHSIWGLDQQFMSSGRIDNLESVYTSMVAFTETNNVNRVNVWAAFDNEEVGSSTKQGAASTLLMDVLKRLRNALDYSKEQFHVALNQSMMLSIDNAHATHPNRPEFNDPMNSVYMNEGVVIKGNANQHYTSDAISIALFKQLCANANVPIQFFYNQSDNPGGSTLGSISNTVVSIKTIDIGCAQLAMHSSYESAGVKDVGYMIAACKAFYESNIVENKKVYTL